MTPSDAPRHAAPLPARQRTVLLPAVLLTVAGLGVGGLAVLPAAAGATSQRVSVSAAAVTAPMLLDNPQPPVAEGPQDLVRLHEATIVPRAAAPASRSRRVAPAPPRYFRPDVGPLTSGFVWRWGRLHTGIDLAGPYGSPVLAVTDGVVIEADQESGYGNIMKVRHPDGTVTVYAHLSRFLVSSGPVKAGQEIASEGDTGHSTGPHLHFEVRINGVPVDPIPWLAKHGVFI